MFESLLLIDVITDNETCIHVCFACVILQINSDDGLI